VGESDPKYACVHDENVRDWHGCGTVIGGGRGSRMGRERRERGGGGEEAYFWGRGGGGGIALVVRGGGGGICLGGATGAVGEEEGALSVL
jgi:hypothetical protein